MSFSIITLSSTRPIDWVNELCADVIALDNADSVAPIDEVNEPWAVDIALDNA